MRRARASIALLLTAAATAGGAGHAATADGTVEAAFRVRSAAPGETAVLDVWSRVRDLQVELVRVGPGGSHEPLGGRPVTRNTGLTARRQRSASCSG